MTNHAPCKHGCGTRVEPDTAICPTCGGPQPHPESPPQGTVGLLEKGCLVVMIFGGLLAGIALIATKLYVGWE